MAGSPDRVDRFYAVVRAHRALLGLVLLEARSTCAPPSACPPSGPVLLCINHPNNLIDSLLVGAVLRRKVHYLATAALFRNPLVARFLPACGAMPVYRKQDDPGRDGPQHRCLLRVLRRARARAARRHLPGGHDALRAARPAHQDGRRPHRPRVRGGPRPRAGASRSPSCPSASPSRRARPSVGACACRSASPSPSRGYLAGVPRGPGQGRGGADHGDPVGDGGRDRPRRAAWTARTRSRRRGSLPRRSRPRAPGGAGALGPARSTPSGCRSRSPTPSPTSRSASPSASSASWHRSRELPRAAGRLPRARRGGAGAARGPRAARGASAIPGRPPPACRLRLRRRRQRPRLLRAALLARRFADKETSYASPPSIQTTALPSHASCRAWSCIRPSASARRLAISVSSPGSCGFPAR